MKYVTIKDIARKLTVSVSTVSRALNNDMNIRQETRDRIIAAAKEMGYFKNPVAMNLKSGRTHTIGVIVPEMSTPYAAKFIDVIQNVCYKDNYKVIIASSAEDPERERENIDIMLQFMVDGIIACRCDDSMNTDMFRKIKDSGIPLVFYDRLSSSICAPQVSIDDKTLAFFLVEHLIRSGRRNIAHITEDHHKIYNAALRFEGYYEALKQYNIPYNPDIVVHAEGMTYSDGASAADKLLSKPIDAVFAFTDTLAIGAMNRLRSIGRRIPDDIAIAGFSGTEISNIVYPKLTTVEPHQFEMGRTAANLLIQHILSPSDANENVIVEADTVYRDSSEI